VATVDYFLKLDGIPGESRDAKHKGEIDLESFSWGATSQGAAGGGGRGGSVGAGKVSMQDFHFTTRVNKASPMLFLSCATGKHIKQATLTARKAGKEQQEFLVFKFTDILISSYQVGGSEGGPDTPMDQVSFNFGQIEYEYREQKPDGSLAGGTTAGWDVAKNKQL
jgi:type VI secretion system secreted protein Hcp